MNRQQRRAAARQARRDSPPSEPTRPAAASDPAEPAPARPGLLWRLFFRVLRSRFLLRRLNHPDIVEMLLPLAEAAGETDLTFALRRKRLDHRPDNTAGRVALAHDLGLAHRWDDARVLFEQVLDADPDHAAARDGLILVLQGQEDWPALEAAARGALDRSPKNPVAVVGLARALIATGRRPEAETVCRAAVRRMPRESQPYALLMNLLVDLGRPADARAVALAGLKVFPQGAGLWLQVRNAHLHAYDYDPATVVADVTRYAEVLGNLPRAPLPPLANHRDPDRRLRLGFVAADFRAHPVARNLRPVLAHRDRARTDVFLYHIEITHDSFTDALRGLADHWREVTALDDDALAARIRDDGIDVLVILAGSFSHNRPLLAARRAAPVQVSYHDVMTSAVRGTDYLIADPVLVPHRSPEPFVERVVRVPSFYIHEAIEPSPAPGPLPARANGAVTFGSASNPRKVTAAVLTLWGRSLMAVPGSRLVLRYFDAYTQPDHQARVLEGLAAVGVAPERVMFSAGTAATSAHLDFYHEVDIALDTRSFSGSTTTFEALWMGVPVVTWPGVPMVSRWSASILTTLGRTRWIAESEGRFVEVAAALAKDLDSLAAERSSLRAAILASPLCDGAAEARQVHRLLRALWRRWCRTGTV